MEATERYLPFKEIIVIKFNRAAKRILQIFRLLIIHVIRSWNRPDSQRRLNLPQVWLDPNNTAFGTFLSCAMLTLEEADAGCFVLGISGVLPCVPQDLGESYFQVLLGGGQPEISGTEIYIWEKNNNNGVL